MDGVLGQLLDLLYPPLCYGCTGQGGESAFCEACWDKMPPPSSPMCPICGLPFRARHDRDHLCGDCLRHRPRFERARACALYDSHDEDSPLRHCIHEYKYRRRTYMARALAEIISRRSPLSLSSYDVVMPVPLHIDRLRWRGFNQALLLAKRIARPSRIPIDPWSLERTIATQPQIELSGSDRRDNVANAFTVRRPEGVRGRKILLVDDVYTTGATVDECARTLKRAKARAIDVLVLARAIVQ